MIDEKTLSHIRFAVRDEMQAAIDKHGEFHSHHEGWAILCEEIQEVMELFKPFCRVADSHTEGLWNYIRNDEMFEDGAERSVKEIRHIAEELAMECIQVIAVCDKWMRLINKEREEVE